MDERGDASPGGGRFHHVFFRIILPNVIEEKKLKLPVKFAREYGMELSTMAKLLLPNHSLWNVALDKRSNVDIWLDDGWNLFAQRNLIGLGYLLVFVYVGSSIFKVEIFDKSTCSIRYTCGPGCRNKPEAFQGNGKMKRKSCNCVVNQTRKEDSSDHRGELRVSGSVQVKDEGKARQSSLIAVGDDEDEVTESGSKRGRKRSRTQLEETTSQPANNRARSTVPLKKMVTCLQERGIHTSMRLTGLPQTIYRTCWDGMQEAMKIQSRYPCFLAVVRSCGPRATRPPTMPASFVTAHIRGQCESITVEVSKGKVGVNKWKLGITPRQGAGLWMRKGWTEFSHNNNLGVGDVCLFQLIHPKDHEMRVSIFRASLK